MKYPLPRVDNSWYSMEGVCNNSFIIHIHRISGGKKIMMKKEEGKKTKKKKCSRLDLNSAPLGCEDSV